MIRTIYSVLCFGSIFIFPWYVSTFLILVGIVLFDFKESLVYGLVMDLTYGLEKPFYLHLVFLSSFFVSYVILFNLKKIVRR
jgi:hypothetical protein